MVKQMSRRAAALLGVAGLVLPSSVLAQRPVLKGQEIDRSGLYDGSTGECSCVTQWYTLGLRPGTVTVTVSIGQTAAANAPTVGIRVALMRGARQKGFGQVGCLVKESPCRDAIHIRYHAPRKGVYYLMVSGLGAPSIPYAIRLQAPSIYALHCGRTC